MKTTIKTILALTALAVAPVTAMAQNTQSGYFVDDYTYRFQMNPAMGNSKNFIGMPALSNVNVGFGGNLHLNSVLYNVNGRTTTFLNPGVSVAEAMSGFSDVNKIGTDIKLNVLSAGFKAFGGYNTVSINARASVNASLPRSIFSLLKEGVSNSIYDIKDVRANAIGYAEVSLGHSRDINKHWRVGANVKLLVGAGSMSADLTDAYLELGTDNWRVVSDGQLRSSVKGLTYKHDVNKHTGHEYVSGIDVDGAGVNGYGLALDLGAVYKAQFLKGLTLSASLLDFGFISWKNDMLASTNGRQEFNTDRYTFNADDDAANSFENEWDKIRDDFSAIYELNDMGDAGGRSQMLHATFNIGAQYEFPLYRKLTFGLLNTTRLAGEFTTTDFRVSANVAPCKIFSCGANIGGGTYGFNFGWLMNLHVTGFNLFLGMDHTPGKLAKQGVPLSSNGSVNLGMNFLF